MIRQIQTELPLWLVLIGLMLAIFLSWISYSGKRNAVVFSKSTRIFLIIIRSMAIFLITLLIIGFFLRTEQKQLKKPFYLLAIDNSISMSNTRQDSFSTEMLQGSVSQIEDFLGERFDVATLYFGEKVRTRDTLNLTDRVTNFSDLAKSIRSRYNTSGIAGMLMVTDGIATSGLSVSGAISDLPFPVSFYALGDTIQGRDIRIEEIQAPEKVLKKNIFDAEVIVSRQYYADGQFTMRVLDESGNLIQDTMLTFNEGQTRQLVKLPLRADSLGLKIWKFEINPLPGEVNIYNNERNLAVRVIEETSSVILIYDQPHPDIRIYHEILQKLDDVQVELWPTSKGVPDSQDFDLALLYQLPQLAKAHTDLRKWLVNTRINTWFVIGPQTDLNKLNEWQDAVDWKAAQLGMEDFEATMQSTFSLFILPEGLDEYLDFVPPLKAPLVAVQTKASSQVLFKQKIKGIELGEPLFWFTRKDQNKSAFWLGEGIWRWYNYEYLNNEDHFFTEYLVKSAVNYLLIKDLEERLIVEAPEVVSSWESIRLKARVLNESYQPVTEPNVKLTLTEPSGQIRTIEFRRLNEDYWLELNRLSAGRYHYLVQTELSGEKFSYQGVIEVQDVPFELLDTKAQFEEMEQVAVQKGGQFFTFGQEKEMSAYFSSLDTRKVEIISATKWVNLLSWFILLLVISGLFILEWSIRRYLGTR